MKISIITVVYNAVETIEQTIRSILMQTFDDKEYIIIDGGSTDGTLDIIKKYSSDLFYISEPDKGIYDAMNKGIDIAKGEYCFFLGADDGLSAANILENISLELTPEVDVLTGFVWIVNEQSHRQYLYGNNYGRSKSDDLVKGGIMAHHQGLFVKSEIMKKHKFDISYKIAADYKLLLELWLNPNYVVKKTNQIISFFSNAGVGSVYFQKRFEEHKQIVEALPLDKLVKKELLHTNFKWKFIQMIKRILQVLGVWEILNAFRKQDVMHKCSWKSCRWCEHEK